MSNNFSRVVILAMIFVSFFIAFYFYPQMPEKIASHWNARGEVNGYMGKFWGLFLMPIISAALFFLFWLLPKIDPLKNNVESFRGYFNWFVVLVIAFLFYLYLLTIFWNLGFRFSLVQLLAPAFSLLFYYCGVLVGKTRRNWFIGIRTPWTLSSDAVWDKTHRISAKLFKILGLISLAGLFLKDCAFFFVLFPAIFFSIFAIAYSFFEYKKEQSQEEGKSF